ncbi:MAG TPA: hypothetical protein VN947_18150 [Polyangia bacterium]|nr:hypothetical protein [Polyangia bacterium]
MDLGPPDLADGRAELCGGAGSRCCTNERAVWVHMGPESCDMAMAPTD